MSKEYKIRVVKGIHSSKDEDFIGEPFDLITVEVDGVAYLRKWKGDMPMEPWMIEPLLERIGGPGDALDSGVLKQYLLDTILQYGGVGNGADTITVDEAEDRVASFNDGWDAHKEWWEQSRKK